TSVKWIGEITGQNSKTLLSALTLPSGIVVPFVLPDEMPEFLKETKKLLQKRQGVSTGLVAMIIPDQSSSNEPIEMSPAKARFHSVGPGFHFSIDPNDFDLETYMVKRPEEIARTHAQIQKSLRTGQPLAVSYLRHEIFTEVVRDYIFADNSQLSASLRIVYNDGTEGCPFPVYSLPELSKADILKNLFKMKVGSISLRHVALDAITDGYLLQNIMVSKRNLSGAEQEDYAFRRTWWFLSNFVDLLQHKRVEEICKKELRFSYLWDLLNLEMKKSNGCELHIFQTGLIPATVGIYRAVIKFLQERRGELIVIPRFIVGSKNNKETEVSLDQIYVESKAWF
ncbi:MAG: hypothetical protein PHE78_07685, partial [Candidatus Gastranaerophilales bacterium]|nr:hypothetical protein [Candidatus Gastranaerophilales bacterium]